MKFLRKFTQNHKNYHSILFCSIIFLKLFLFFSDFKVSISLLIFLVHSDNYPIKSMKIPRKFKNTSLDSGGGWIVIRFGKSLGISLLTLEDVSFPRSSPPPPRDKWSKKAMSNRAVWPPPPPFPANIIPLENPEAILSELILDPWKWLEMPPTKKFIPMRMTGPSIFPRIFLIGTCFSLCCNKTSSISFINKILGFLSSVNVSIIVSLSMGYW